MSANLVIAVTIGWWTLSIAIAYSAIAYVVNEKRRHRQEMEHRAALIEINQRGRDEWQAMLRETDIEERRLRVARDDAYEDTDHLNP